MRKAIVTIIYVTILLQSGAVLGQNNIDFKEIYKHILLATTKPLGQIRSYVISNGGRVSDDQMIFYADDASSTIFNFKDGIINSISISKEHPTKDTGALQSFIRFKKQVISTYKPETVKDQNEMGEYSEALGDSEYICHHSYGDVHRYYYVTRISNRQCDISLHFLNGSITQCLRNGRLASTGQANGSIVINIDFR